ncbi:hypothetical protein [Clostridium botulinum]|uniref:hypothetical protein n=1 Tax=Clostridium botulinum TaxID=1491 RepID=UPI003DA4AA0C
MKRYIMYLLYLYWLGNKLLSLLPNQWFSNPRSFDVILFNPTARLPCLGKSI